MSEEQEKKMGSNQMNGLANAACVKADIITRKSANTPVNTAICAAVTEVLNVVEEEEKTTVITIMANMTDTETQKVRTRDSGDQKAKTNPTKDQPTGKEPRENH